MPIIRGSPLVVAAPVRGQWQAFNSPATKIPSHGTNFRGQTYGVDLVFSPVGQNSLTSESSRSSLRPPEDFPSFGAPVFAVANGTVVRAHDAERDRTRGISLKCISSASAPKNRPVCISPHEENPETDLEKEWSPRHQGWEPRTNTGPFARNPDMFVPEHVDQRRIIHGHESLEYLAGLKVPLDIGIGYRNVLHVVTFNFLKESAEGNGLSESACGVLHKVVEQHCRQEHQGPERNRFHCRIQMNLP